MSDHADRADSTLSARMTFIVRLDASESAGVAGIVEHATSGRKERFRGVEAISEVIAALMKLLATSQRAPPSPLPSMAPGHRPRSES